MVVSSSFVSVLLVCNLQTARNCFITMCPAQVSYHYEQRKKMCLADQKSPPKKWRKGSSGPSMLDGYEVVVIPLMCVVGAYEHWMLRQAAFNQFLAAAVGSCF